MKSWMKRWLGVAVLMGASVVAVAQEVIPANAEGETVLSIPADGVASVSVPYRNPADADGMFRFGETGIAQGLPEGSVVFFWDGERQKWGGGMKSAFGWEPAEANRVLAVGEGFCVRNGGTEALEVAAGGEIPPDECLVCAYRGGGAWTLMAYPYPDGGDEGDGSIRFGETDLAGQLPSGAQVRFWDANSQSWSGGTKSAKGWSASLSQRVIGMGEAFFIRSGLGDDDGEWVVEKPYEWP